MTTDERFWSKVVKTETCWIWKASLSVGGYGKFALPSRKLIPAHRYAYETLVGPIPVGLQLDHLCRNRACVNPSHLESVTARTNLLRGESLSAQNARKTHCRNGHPLIGDNLVPYSLSRGQRRCLTCERAYDKEYVARNKDEMAQRNKEWREANKDYVREKQAGYRAARKARRSAMGL